jgi:hypothetical protein
MKIKTAASEWIVTYPAEIMDCDMDGIILEMSDVSIQIYEKEGGAKMIGKNHHEELPRSQILNVVNQRKHVIYTTEKGGLKKLVPLHPGTGKTSMRALR